MKTLFASLLVAWMLSLVPGSAEAAFTGSVQDASSGKLLAGVELRTVDNQVFTDAAGRFALTTASRQMVVRFPGYRAQQVALSSPLQIALQPFTPKALYLSFWGADVPAKRAQISDLITAAQLNAIVIDIKSARGHIAYRSNIPLAKEIGAQRVRPLKDLPQYLAQLKAQGIYTIGRMVVFKDDLLARQRPEFAVRSRSGDLWQDRDKLSWSDPFNQRVREYNLAVAEEAAQLGFDEIQFDYIRFPAKADLVFSQQPNDTSRVTAINSFLSQAKQRLAAYPVFTSANIFGYICWKHKDGKIGQRLVDLGQRVDYLAPMLYPSGFQRGIPGFDNPLDHSYEVIAMSLQKAQQLSGLPAVRFRPWLQAFRDYAFDRRSFNADEVHAQINASDAVGSNGWMLWNAASRFSLAGLQQKVPLGELKLVDIEPRLVEPAMLTTAEFVGPRRPVAELVN